MRPITTKDRLRYHFDNVMSRGAIAMIGGLSLVTALMVSAAAIFLSITGIAGTGNDNPHFIENLWMSMMRAMDPGTVAGDNGWPFRIVMFAVTIGGIFIVSSLISIISAGLDTRIEQMRKGRSFVVENNHVLILGWSSKIYTIIKELIVANESQTDAVIVILADRDKVEMDDDIRANLPRLKNTRVVTRSGCPTDMTDLDLVNPYQSRSIIILAPESDTADAEVVKTILAICNSPQRRSEKYHIVAEMKDSDHIQVAKLVGKDEVELIAIDDLIARITVQSCRQSGLSVVYAELMDFGGGEIYFRQFRELTGKTYAEVINRFASCAVMGVQHADKSVSLNPYPNTIIEAGDSIVALTEDDSTFVCEGSSHSVTIGEVVPYIQDNPAERTLVLGWNKKGRQILEEMDLYVSKGSSVTVIANFDLESVLDPLSKELKNFELHYFEADTATRPVLEQLHVNDFQHVVLLSYQDTMSLQQADATTLMTLLHLRDIWEKAGRPLKIVTEMLDLRNRDLASVTRADDFIVSDKLMSLLMAQVAENKYLMRVFEDLFHHEGSEIYIKPIKEYVQPGQTTDFYGVVNAALAKGETAIGYRRTSLQYDAEQNYGLKLNPVKSSRLTFDENDQIIVLAEH